MIKKSTLNSMFLTSLALFFNFQVFFTIFLIILVLSYVEYLIFSPTILLNKFKLFLESLKDILFLICSYKPWSKWPLKDTVFFLLTGRLFLML